MSQNIGSNDPNRPTTHTTGGASTGATDAGTTRDTSTSLTPSQGQQTGGAAAAGSGTGAASAKGLAQEYGQRAADAATHAKDYVADKMSAVGDKFKDLQNKDFSQVADEAKEYARQKPGQALLISAAAGFLIGLLLRSSNRR